MYNSKTNYSENSTQIIETPKITDQHQGVNHLKQGGNALSPAADDTEEGAAPLPSPTTTTATAPTGRSNNLSELPQQSKVILFTRYRDMVDRVSKI